MTIEEKKKKKKTYKQLFATKHYLLTASNMVEYETLEKYMSNITESSLHPEIRSIVISQEQHKNGIHHYHALLIFKKRKAIYKNDAFNFIFNKQVNIQSVKSPKHALDYIKKDGNFIESGEKLVFKENTKKAEEAVRASIFNFLNKEDRQLSDLAQISSAQTDPIIYNDSIKIERWFQRTQSWFRQAAYEKRTCLDYFDLDALEKCEDRFKVYARNIRPILDFTNQNINSRRSKSKNLLIFSHLPDTGKSSFLNLINIVSPSYIFPLDNWFPSWKNDLYTAIIWDELSFIGTSMTFLKLFFGGSTMALPVKNSNIQKTSNPLILCASNHNLKQLFKLKYRYKCSCGAIDEDNETLCYGHKIEGYCTVIPEHQYAYKAMYSRLHIIELKGPIYPKGDDGKTWEDWNDFLQIIAIPSEKKKEPLP